MKTIFRFLFILIIACGSAVPVSADESGPITGKFSPSIGPQITSIEVLDESYKPVFALTPSTYYYIKVTVSDSKGIGHLNNIDLKMWYDDSGKGSKTDETTYFDPDSTYSGNGYRRIQFEWDRDSNSNRRLSAYATNWEIDQTSGLPLNWKLEDPSITSYSFLFRVFISRGANEAVDGNVWQIAARVKNKSDQSAYTYYGGVNKGLPLNYYGEISVKAGSKVDWGGVVAGLKFQDAKSHANVSDDMTYFANGLFSVKVKSSKVWTRTDKAATVTLSSDASSPRTFAIRSFLGPKPSYALNAVSLSADGADTIVKEGENYGEGDFMVSVASGYNNLYLQVNADALPGTYNGLITFSIVNR